MSRLTTGTHSFLTEDVIRLLHSKNIRTTEHFINTDTKQLASITNLMHKDISVIRTHIINKTAAVIRNGACYYKELLQNSALIPTGIKQLDKLLEGGLMTGKIYEICGPPASGKTQFCLTLARNVSKNLQQNVYYIDTKRDFSAKRVKSMLQDVNEMEACNIMLRILVKRVTTKYELLNSLFDIKKEISNGLKVRIIILDSLPCLFTNTDEYNVENNTLLNHMANIMHYLATECFVAIVVINLITVWSIGDFQEPNVKENISCGKYWLTVPHVRLKFERNEDNYKISVLKNQSKLSNSICFVKVENEGMR